MSKGLIYLIDMESSLSEALVRRVIDMNQYVIFRKWDMEVNPVAEMEAYKKSLKAVIISGSYKNVNGKKNPPPQVPAEIFHTGVPILAICYGMQYLASLQGVPIVRCWDEKDPQKRTNKAAKEDKGEHGVTLFHRTAEDSILFQGLGSSFPVWMKHNWMLEAPPANWKHTGSTEKCPVASMELGNIFALQFHPEPANSLFGRIILHNFLGYACGLTTPYF